MAITLDGTTGISSVDGSNASPSLRGSDANSGIVYAADTVSISTGGTERLEVDSSGNIDIPDNGKIRLGSGNDLDLYHDGSHSYLTNSTGIFHLRGVGDGIRLQKSDGERMLYAIPDGSVELYYDDTKTFETTSAGARVTGNLHVTSNLLLEDNDKAKFGDGEDLEIYHSSGDNYLYRNAATNYTLIIQNDGNSSNRYGFIVRCGANNAAGTNYAMTITDGDQSTQGYITFSGGTVSYGAFTAHHPCIVPDADNPSDSSNAYPYGTLLETISIEYTQKNGSDTERGIRYKVQKTQSANSKKILGAYGGSMNGGPEGQKNEHQVLILGDGHILVNNAGGNIEVGDGICSSATAGIGRKATANPSMIIGIAQEAITFTGSETKLVAVQYGLQQFIPWN